jgi:GNAT superfamily N-acetyltransferase
MKSLSNIETVEKLSSQHQTHHFKCGKNSLDLFIRKYALINQRADSSQTYVVHQGGMVIGYYSLSFSSVRREEAPLEIQAEMPGNYAIPVMLFARFAVHREFQGQGLGEALLRDAFLRTIARPRSAASPRFWSTQLTKRWWLITRDTDSSSIPLAIES